MRNLILAAVLVLPAMASGQSVPPQFTLESGALAAKIVERLDLRPGERFLLVAHPGLYDELIRFLRYEAMRAGAVDLGVIDVLEEPVPEGWNEDTLRKGGIAARAALAEMLADVDASVMLPGASTAHPAYLAVQDLLREGKGRTVHFHWLQGGGAIPIAGQPLPPVHAIESSYQRAVLDADYEALAGHQRRFAQAMRAGEIRVTSPAGTDIRFRIGDRPVNFQDGDASAARTDGGVILIDREIELPAGAIRVAPLEDSVYGTIAFPPSQWSGRPVNGLELTFEAGRVVSVSADSGLDAVEAELTAAGPAGRAFREFGLGFHPLLAIPEQNPWIPYYGYGAGVVRLSLGDNSELGGDVTGGYYRWNFFTDTTVTVDGDVWVRDGKLVR